MDFNQELLDSIMGTISAQSVVKNRRCCGRLCWVTCDKCGVEICDDNGDPWWYNRATNVDYCDACAFQMSAVELSGMFKTESKKSSWIDIRLGARGTQTSFCFEGRGLLLPGCTEEAVHAWVNAIKELTQWGGSAHPKSDWFGPLKCWVPIKLERRETDSSTEVHLDLVDTNEYTQGRTGHAVLTRFRNGHKRVDLVGS